MKDYSKDEKAAYLMGKHIGVVKQPLLLTIAKYVGFAGILVFAFFMGLFLFDSFIDVI